MCWSSPTFIRPAKPPIRGITAEALADAIRAAGHKNVVYCATLQEGIDYLLREARPGDAVLAIGAGNVNRALGELAAASRPPSCRRTLATPTQHANPQVPAKRPCD